MPAILAIFNSGPPTQITRPALEPVFRDHFQADIQFSTGHLLFSCAPRPWKRPRSSWKMTYHSRTFFYCKSIPHSEARMPAVTSKLAAAWEAREALLLTGCRESRPVCLQVAGWLLSWKGWPFGRQKMTSDVHWYCTDTRWDGGAFGQELHMPFENKSIIRQLLEPTEREEKRKG